MNETSKEPMGVALGPTAIVAQQLYALYGMMPLDWHWDTFDLSVLAIAAGALVSPVMRDVRSWHHNWIVVPRERAWAADRASRRHRRALTNTYLRTHRER